MLAANAPWPLFLCLLAAALIGLSKGGFAGIGSLATPLVALAMPPTVAAAVLLPVLISQDVVGVWSFRQEWDRWIVSWMLPGAIVGIVVGWNFAGRLDDKLVAAAIGLISGGFALWRLWIERHPQTIVSSSSPGWVGCLFGTATGLASQIAHAGAPPFQMWVAPRRLPHTVYVGTNAVLFAAINWLKVPAYLALGALTPPVLATSAILIPVALTTTLASLRWVRKMPGPRFYFTMYYIMILLGGYLVARTL